jgi:hypothetical protein
MSSKDKFEESIALLQQLRAPANPSILWLDRSFKPQNGG